MIYGEFLQDVFLDISFGEHLAFFFPKEDEYSYLSLESRIYRVRMLRIQTSDRITFHLFWAQSAQRVGLHLWIIVNGWSLRRVVIRHSTPEE